MDLLDDLGVRLALPGPPTRVVSLVPSLTEAVAATRPGVLVGATDYCSYPVDLDVARVGGTKWPSIAAVLALKPDLVLANAEENRREDVAALRAAGVAVWVTFPQTVDEALASLGRMVRVLGSGRPGWLDAAVAAWAAPAPPDGPAAVIAVWRRPWVVVGSGTFAGDVLARLGVRNLYAGAAERYPRPPLRELLERDADLVVLPDEPYPFSDSDGPECFPGLSYALVSGRHLTWYGPSLVEAPAVLRRQLAAAHR